MVAQPSMSFYRMFFMYVLFSLQVSQSSDCLSWRPLQINFPKTTWLHKIALLQSTRYSVVHMLHLIMIVSDFRRTWQNVHPLRKWGGSYCFGYSPLICMDGYAFSFLINSFLDWVYLFINQTFDKVTCFPHANYLVNDNINLVLFFFSFELQSILYFTVQYLLYLP